MRVRRLLLVRVQQDGSYGINGQANLNRCDLNPECSGFCRMTSGLAMAIISPSAISLEATRQKPFPGHTIACAGLVTVFRLHRGLMGRNCLCGRFEARSSDEG